MKYIKKVSKYIELLYRMQNEKPNMVAVFDELNSTDRGADDLSTLGMKNSN